MTQNADSVTVEGPSILGGWIAHCRLCTWVCGGRRDVVHHAAVTHEASHNASSGTP